MVAATAFQAKAALNTSAFRAPRSVFPALDVELVAPLLPIARRTKGARWKEQGKHRGWSDIVVTTRKLVQEAGRSENVVGFTIGTREALLTLHHTSMNCLSRRVVFRRIQDGLGVSKRSVGI